MSDTFVSMIRYHRLAGRLRNRIKAFPWQREDTHRFRHRDRGRENVSYECFGCPPPRLQVSVPSARLDFAGIRRQDRQWSIQQGFQVDGARTSPGLK